MIESFRDLDVYKKAFLLSVSIHRTSRSFPKEEQFGLTNQIRRSSKSICANLAEGFGKQRFSKAEFKRFIAIAQGSAHEVLVWIDYCKEFEYVDKTVYEEWANQTNSIIRMLNGLYNKV